jgi:16S rRNA G966 N2-methylase RsmD
MKALYYGDNLQVLRDSIATESVDLNYLDPPFNSKATYNVGLLGISGRDRMHGRTAAWARGQVREKDTAWDARRF